MTKRKIYWTLLIVWMIFIFYMSSKNGTESNDMSDVIVNILRYSGIGENEVIQSVLQFLVRKSAHISEYCILAILIFNVVKEYNNLIETAVFSLILSVLYATTDEIHQLFVPGRTGKITDVLIDSIGILVGIVIVYLINIRKRTIRKASIS